MFVWLQKIQRIPASIPHGRNCVCVSDVICSCVSQQRSPSIVFLIESREFYVKLRFPPHFHKQNPTAPKFEDGEEFVTFVESSVCILIDQYIVEHPT